MVEHVCGRVSAVQASEASVVAKVERVHGQAQVVRKELAERVTVTHRAADTKRPSGWRDGRTHRRLSGTTGVSSVVWISASYGPRSSRADVTDESDGRHVGENPVSRTAP
jgi:hypothetical protein